MKKASFALNLILLAISCFYFYRYTELNSIFADSDDYTYEEIETRLLENVNLSVIKDLPIEEIAEKKRELESGSWFELEQVDEVLAVRIALDFLVHEFGEEQIRQQQPFVAVDLGDLWYIHGTLPMGTVGGTGEAMIDKKSGKIIGLRHTL